MVLYLILPGRILQCKVIMVTITSSFFRCIDCEAFKREIYQECVVAHIRLADTVPCRMMLHSSRANVCMNSIAYYTHMYAYFCRWQSMGSAVHRHYSVTASHQRVAKCYFQDPFSKEKMSQWWNAVKWSWGKTEHQNSWRAMWPSETAPGYT